MLSPEWNSLGIAALSILGILLWVMTHVWTGRWLSGSGRSWGGRGFQWLKFGLLSIIASTTLWLVSNLLDRVVVLNTSWSIPAICLFCGIVVEGVISLYRFERAYVQRNLGLGLAGIRIGLVLILGLMLLQPTIAWNINHVDERFIAVLVDRSDSMDISDQQLTDSEKLRLIRVFDESIAKTPYELSETVSELSEGLKKLEIVTQTLEQIEKNKAGANEFGISRLAMKKTIHQVQKTAQTHAEKIGDLLTTNLGLAKETIEAATLAQSSIDELVVARLVGFDQLIDKDTSTEDLIPELITLLQDASADFRTALNRIPSLIDAADRSFFASLPPEQRTATEQLVNQTRAQIARILLLGDSKQQIPGLLDKIRQGYGIRLFEFSSDCAELDLDRWSKEGKKDSVQQKKQEDTVVPEENTVVPEENTTASKEDSKASEEDTEKPEKTPPAADKTASPQPQRSTKMTDMATALAMIESEFSWDQLAGVLLVTDGRHNTANDVEEIARRFQANQTPLAALIVGSSRPPVDASIVDVEYPQTVLLNDVLRVNTRVKLTGMNQRQVRATLMEGETILTEKTISIQSDDLTTSIPLEYNPTEEKIGRYRVEVKPIDSDEIENQAFASNNSREISVAVSDDRTEILLIEEKTRWEYGYLRNLFAGRDERVKLQSVLLKPELLLGRGKPTPYPASVANEKREANALPVEEAEWLKFDVIILGDLAPESLPVQHQQAIHHFVNKRGGTLIVIAGQRNMPHRYPDTLLSELLPIEFEPKTEDLFQSPETKFNFRLSSVGKRHPIFRLDDAAEKSDLIWESIPPMYWRHDVLNPKAGATVLSFAETEKMAPLMVAKGNETVKEKEQRRTATETYEKTHALTVVQQFGLGRVLMMNTDRTWRLRYRVGDTYHHRLWGQIIRWATSERLQGGNEFVQVGASKASYNLGEPVLITTKLTDSFFSPIQDPNAEIQVFQDDKLLFSKLLQPVPSNPGSYQANLGGISEAGRFKIRLVSSEAEKVFAGEQNEPIETEILINPAAVVSKELIDPTADRAAISRLTAIGGGGMVESDSSESVLRYFSPGTNRYTETRSFRLWDTWPLLTLLLTLLTVEWIFRKKGGLI